MEHTEAEPALRSGLAALPRCPAEEPAGEPVEEAGGAARSAGEELPVQD